MNDRLPHNRSATIRTVPMPADANHNGDIFGGWVLAQMDIAGGVVAAERAKGRVATVAIDSMTFVRPISIGDVVSVFAEVVKVGRTSMHVKIETFVHRRDEAEKIHLRVTEGTFVYVALDEHKRSRPIESESGR